MQHKTNFLLACCLFVTLSTLIGGCRKNEESNCSGVFPMEISVDCDNSAQDQDELRREAMRLSLAYYTEFEIMPPDAFIPESVWMPFFQALSATRTAIPQIECEDLNSLLEIEAGYDESLTQFIVELDTAYAWTNAWRNKITETGDPSVDSFMNKYALTLYDYYEFTSSEYAMIESAEPLNPRQLRGELGELDGVLYADPNQRIGDGDRIEALYEGSDIVLEFSNGYGDCPSGCINRDTWRFRVNEDCLVVYESFEQR